MRYSTPPVVQKRLDELISQLAEIAKELDYLSQVVSTIQSHDVYNLSVRISSDLNWCAKSVNEREIINPLLKETPRDRFVGINEFYYCPICRAASINRKHVGTDAPYRCSGCGALYHN